MDATRLLTRNAQKRRRCARRLYVPALVLVLSQVPIAVYGQAVRGTIKDTTTGLPVANARVSMSNTLGQVVATAVSGPDGGFVVGALHADSYIITIQQLGFRPLVSNPQVLRTADTLDLVYHFHPLPVQLDPVVVKADAVARYAEVRHLEQQGFYVRLRQTHGRFLDPAAIDRRRDHTRRADHFLTGNAHVTSLSGSRRGYRLRCGRPDFYIDDRKYWGDDLDQAVDPDEVLAIEIYDLVRAAQKSDIMYGRCAVVVWTRAAAQSGN